MILKIYKRFHSTHSKVLTLTKTLADKIYNGNLELANREVHWLNQYIRDKEFTLEQLLKDRIHNHKPLQYILGDQPFGNLNILTKKPILIPRWETEEWTIELANLINKDNKDNTEDTLNILEIGTGSGCIPLLLSSMIERKANIYSIDKNEKAISLALENLSNNQSLLKNKVQFNQINLFDLPDLLNHLNNIGPLDIIVSNPPYISPVEYQDLEPDVKLWEDIDALKTEDENGLQFYKYIINLFEQNNIFKTKNNTFLPKLVFEFGTKQQGLEIANLMREANIRPQIKKDLSGKERAIYGY